MYSCDIHLASLAKSVSLRFQPLWLRVQIPLLSLKLQLHRACSEQGNQEISESNSFSTRMWQKQRNAQSMHHTGMFSQHNTNRPVWLNDRVFVSEISGCGFKLLLLVLKLQMERLFRTRGSLTFRQFQIENSLNPFVPNTLFLYPLKTS